MGMARATISLFSLPETCPFLEDFLGALLSHKRFFCQTHTLVMGRHRSDLPEHRIQCHLAPNCTCTNQGTHTLNTAALLAGLGHLNNPQSQLSGKFWPRPRQSAGFAQTSPRRCDDPAGRGKVTYAAWEEKRCLPRCSLSTLGSDFLHGHSLATTMPSCELFHIRNLGFC